MTDTLLFIPPCCVDVKLPKAIKESPSRSLIFYTHGDVPMEKFYRALAFLVGDPHVMVLSIPTITKNTAAFLAQCFDREWITDLILITDNNMTELVDKYLGPYRDHLLYCIDSSVSDTNSHLVLYSEQQSLCLFGPMYNIGGTSTLVSYSLSIYNNSNFHNNKDYGNAILNALLPDVLHLRKWTRNKDLRSKSDLLINFLHMRFPPYLS